jgi:cupin 2 domain-containing protein
MITEKDYNSMNTMNELKNIFENVPEVLNDEFFEDLLVTNNFKLERIVSDGHSSPANFWYELEKNELVLLLSGSAELSYDDGQRFYLAQGDYLTIPAHQKHRVDKTDLFEKTFWLALHF